MARGRIVSLGSINADFQVRAERWPDPGETLLGRDFLLLGGGKAANVAFLAQRLGAPALLIGHVGDDPLAERALEPLRAAGIDLSQVTAVAGGTTGASLIVVRPDGDKTIVLAANANDAWQPQDAAAAAAAVADAGSGSLLVADLEVPAFVVREAIDAARGQGFPVLLDPSPAARLDDELYPLVDYITPNPSEARQLTGITVDGAGAARRAGEQLRRRGAGIAFMKLSDGGCVVVGDNLREHVEGFAVEVIDTTGAGDAFAGALAVALWEGKDPVAAARFATAASSLAVSGYGSQPAYPDRRAVEGLLESRR
ncbi:MAG: ribokinase [Pseudomonadota bacterium]|nr:ribokinase [Pseudomonadota bacterium]